MLAVFGRTYSEYEIDTPRDDKPLMVLSAGHVVLLKRACSECLRPNGRRDYQILYVHSGKMRFLWDEQEHIVPSGNAVLYRPGECQHYQFLLENCPDVYWIHFTGSNVPKELESMGFAENRIFPVGKSDDYAQLFNQIIQELQLKYRNYSEMAGAFFKQLLCSFSRELLDNEQTFIPRTQEIEDAVRIFNTQFNESINLAEYAASLNMSLCWFARIFQRQMGVSPQRYLMEVRISRACQLLGSGIGVAETSELVGYTDPGYFSRVFKKYTGCMPSAYQQTL